MNKYLTDKTMVIVAKLGDFWVSPTQGHKIMDIKNSDNTAVIELEGNFISVNSIDGLLMPEAYEVYNFKRQGAFQCKYKKWHPRNQQCAHHMVADGTVRAYQY